MLTIPQFEDYVRAWAIRRHEHFQYLWPLKGGWETWIQADLVAYIFSEDGLLDVLREQPIYTNAKQKVDILLNTNAEYYEDEIPVEIKAQSIENVTNFMVGIHEDMLKLTTKRHVDYAECRCVLMGMCFKPEDFRKLKDYRVDNHRIFDEVYRGGDGEISILVARLSKKNEWEWR